MSTKQRNTDQAEATAAEHIPANQRAPIRFGIVPIDDKPTEPEEAPTAEDEKEPQS